MKNHRRRISHFRRITALFLVVVIAFSVSACGKKNKNGEPITITVWHVYGEQTNSPLNDMIDEFNQTEGRKRGIRVQVNVVSNTNDIHETVLRAANNEPGAGELPDMFISYPKTVMALPDRDILVDYHDYFTDEELAMYIPEFIEEGEIDGALTVFPLAKSTEVLYVNKTFFDRFADETGASLNDLSTWEGLYDTAKKYYDWTDAKTPDVADDGKTFFVNDYHFDYYQVGVTAMGEEFFEGDGLKDSAALKYAYSIYADAALYGAIWLNEGYATESLRTGDVVCSVASSAAVLYYDDYVTYSDNTTEPIEVIAMPVPVFEGTEKLVMQRGAGFCTVKSTKAKEQAACIFLKWITAPENNIRLVTSLGYMPVTSDAFEEMPEVVSDIEDSKYRSLYEAFIATQENYTFYSAPKFDNYLSLETKVENMSRSRLRAEHDSLDSYESADIVKIINIDYEEFRAITP